MYLTLLLYLILGILFLFFPKTTLENNYKLKIDKLIKEDCSNKKMKCIDTCDFLCTDSSYKCVNNVCQLDDKIECGHGIIALTDFNNIPFWECLCTDPSYYGGKECKTQAPDVCKNGTFVYRDWNRHICKCRQEDILMTLNQKEYCIPKSLTTFFP